MYLINKGNNTQLLHYKNHISLLTILHNTFINQAVIQINKSIIIYNMQKAHHSSLPPSLPHSPLLSLFTHFGAFSLPHLLEPQQCCNSSAQEPHSVFSFFLHTHPSEAQGRRCSIGAQRVESRSKIKLKFFFQDG